MKKSIKTIICITLAALLLAFIPATSSFAYGTDMSCMDFEDSTITVAAGSSHTMTLRATYDYTYFVKEATSKGTYLEGNFKSGTQQITFHVGADETAKSVFFYFYVRDDRLETQDKWDVIQVNVKNAAPAAPVSTAAALAGGKTGSVAKINDNVLMLNNQDGVGMASFSLSDGNGHMLPITYKGIANNGSSYFDVACYMNNAVPKISESDKAVMTANGYAGVCVNGVYKNWN